MNSKWTQMNSTKQIYKKNHNSNVEQSDDTHDKSFLEYTILAKVKDGVVYITEGRNGDVERFILELVKQTVKYKDWLNIVDQKRNIETIDWKSIKSWKRDLTEFDRFIVLQNNTIEKEIKQAKLNKLNSWEKNVYEEVDYKN